MFELTLLNLGVLSLVVILHYEFLFQLTRLLPLLRVRNRFRILIGVFVSIFAHSAEVWIFGIAYYFKYLDGRWGTFSGNFNGTLLDCVYFSYTTYTTLGFGDIYATGEIRYLIGAESLVGLVLITWTASFLFIEMQKYWKE